MEWNVTTKQINSIRTACLCCKAIHEKLVYKFAYKLFIQFLEDLTVTYDGTVRDSRGDIVQFRYGSDGLDPGEMEVENFPADLKRELANIKVCFSKL